MDIQVPTPSQSFKPSRSCNRAWAVKVVGAGGAGVIKELSTRLDAMLKWISHPRVRGKNLRWIEKS